MQDQPLPPGQRPGDLPSSSALISSAAISALDTQLRALARTLVADEDAASEAVQEAWLAILGRPAEEIQSARPWLKQVLRHRVAAIMRRRSLGRDAEEHFAKEQPSARGDTSAEVNDGQDLLRRAIGGLAEPYRAVLERRFFEEQSIAEIAGELERPEGTVRSQITRGIAELRRVMDERHGGRANWTTILLPLAGLSSRTVKAAGVGGSQLPIWVATAALALATLLVGLWWVKHEAGGGPKELLLSQVEQLSEPERQDPPGSIEAPSDDTPSRAPAAERAVPAEVKALGGKPDAPKLELPAQTSPAAAATVRIELRDPSGVLSVRPVVEFRDAHRLVRRLEFDENPFDLEILKSDTIEGMGLKSLFAVSAVNEARSPTIAVELKKLTGKTLSMATRGLASTVYFSAVDERGEPVEGAVILMGPKGVQSVAVHDEYMVGHIGTEVVTDSAGRATIAAAPREIRMLRVQASGFSVLEREIALEDEKESVELTLQAGAVLRGSVRGATGEPLAGARVSIVEQVPLIDRPTRVETFTDERGEYVLAGIDRRLSHVFAEWSPGASQAAPTMPVAGEGAVPLVASTVIDPTEPGDLVWDARPVPHYGLTLRFRDESGKPFAGVFAMIAPTSVANAVPKFISMLRTDATGMVQFPLVPDFPVNARVERGVHGAFLVKSRFTRAVDRNVVTDVVVPRQAARGASLGGTLVLSSKTSTAPSRVLLMNGEDRIYADVDPSSGSFRFEDLLVGTYRATALWTGLGAMDLGTVTPTVGEHIALGELPVPSPVEVRVTWGATPPSREEPWAVSWNPDDPSQALPPSLVLDEPVPSFRVLPGDYLLYHKAKSIVIPVQVAPGSQHVEVP